MKKSIFLLAVCALCAAACTKTKSAGQDSGKTLSNPEAKREIVVSMGSRIPHEFEPKKRWGMYNEAHILHSTLLQKTADLDIVGDFAKDYTISPDGKTWTFHLYDNFKFSNGEPVTAEDVKFSYEMLKEDGK